MAKYIYPTKEDLEHFIAIVIKENISIKKYLPPLDKEWYRVISDSIKYVEHVSHYREETDMFLATAQLLYKVAKRHELGDGNKRSAVIATYLFCVLNYYVVIYPQKLKSQAKRIASTKGRVNEEMMEKRVAKALQEILMSEDEIKRIIKTP